MANYYPLLVDLNKIKCLVIGGGEVAHRKTLSLREAGADITLISPRVINPLLKMAEEGEMKIIKRAYQKGDLKGFRLVYAAINDQKGREEIAKEAGEEGILLNIADNPSAGNFIVPSKIQRGDLYLCFSTNGKSPLLAKKIRQDLEARYGREYEEFLQLLGRERVWALQEVAKIDQRKAYFEELVFSDLLDLLKSGQAEVVNQRIKAMREKLCPRKQEGKLMANKYCTAYLVGAGPGDYKLITLKAVECLKKADVVIYDRLANKRYLDFTKEGSEMIYVGKASDCHALPQEQINKLIVKKAKEGKTVVRLKGGDPYLFGRGGEEAEELRQEGIPFEVVPGITSAISVPAYAGIPVTHRDFVSSVHIITGHEKPEKNVSNIDYQLLAKLKGTLIFLMGLGNLGSICSNLIKYGKPQDTPVAVISKGTTPAQKKAVGTLADIEEIVNKVKLLPPSIIIVGEVVSLHDRLDWFYKKPLSGKRVLITRTRNQASTLAEKIEDLGGEVFSFPTIKILEPEDFSQIDRKLNEIDGYDWIIFTSVNGVEAFFHRLKTIKRDIRSLKGVKIGAIGSSTGAALEESGVIADYIPKEFQAEALARGLKERIKAGEKVLLPTADIARKLLSEELTARGVIVDKVDMYRTIPGEGDRELLLEWLKHKEVDIITFASSSTVKNFVNILGGENLSLLKGVKVACIGPVTGGTAEELGLKVDISPAEFTIDGLVEALLQEESGE